MVEPRLRLLMHMAVVVVEALMLPVETDRELMVVLVALEPHQQFLAVL